MRQPCCEPRTPSSRSVVTWCVLNRPLLPDNKSHPPLPPTSYLVYWLLRISVRRCGSLKESIWDCDGRCHGLWRGRSYEANTFALRHTVLKPEIQLAMWNQEEGERW